jgi:hypothetical protein
MGSPEPGCADRRRSTEIIFIQMSPADAERQKPDREDPDGVRRSWARSSRKGDLRELERETLSIERAGTVLHLEPREVERAGGLRKSRDEHHAPVRREGFGAGRSDIDDA